METLTDQILHLSREQAFEAVLALQSSFPSEQAAEIDELAPVSQFLTELNAQPFGLVDELEQVARAFLLTVAQDPELTPRVATIVAGTGRKNYIFGADELRTAGKAGLQALAALQTWWSNGRAKNTLTVTIEPDGRYTVSCDQRLLYENNSRVGELFAAIMQNARQHAANGFAAFLSYRRLTDSETARAIRSELKTRQLRAFLDIDDLGRAAFDEQILQRINETPNFVIILSPTTLDRCLDPADWVRQEIGHALRTGKNVVPLLRDGFVFPPTDQLPGELRDLPRLNGVNYSHTHFDDTINKLIKFLKL